MAARRAPSVPFVRVMTAEAWPRAAESFSSFFFVRPSCSSFLRGFEEPALCVTRT